ncbi:MAG TPA: TRIC cation channel family protein [Anaeromyxobacteraceae bacterium]|nr:TRIC cation channel family protein [Anaeromyxobacteraceae bacterium]
MTPTEFSYPLALDLAATLLFAGTGALAGVRKGYDLVGIAVLALVTGLGGALLRDGLFLESGRPSIVVSDGRFLAAVLVGAWAGTFLGRHLERLPLVIGIVDAAALGLYAVVGAQKALVAGLGMLAAILIGVVNAVGGSVLRDVLSREEPLLFKPGEFYALAALVGCVCFVLLRGPAGVDPRTAAFIAIAATWTTRFLSIGLGWRTGTFAEDG